MNKLFIALILAGLAVTGCEQKSTPEASQEGQAETAVVTETQGQAEAVDPAHTARNALDWSGTYKGILPCADCEGIDTELQINDDGTFVLTEEYLGKEAGTLTYEGKFNWNAAGNTIAVPNDSDAVEQYFVAENQLFRLDSEGQRITGDLAEKYVLKKQ